MEFQELVIQRRSVRAFERTPVGPDKIDAILETVNLAPSAGNLQAYEIFLVTHLEHRRALAAAAFGQTFLEQAPVALVFCAAPRHNAEKYRERGARLYAPQDATIACTFAMLAIADAGLATVWVGAFDDDAVRRVIGVGNELTPVAILPIGYAAEQPQSPGRRALSRTVHRLDERS
jgi:nitroreductase